MKKFLVYEHVNKVNGKKYIGITCKNVKTRWGKDGSGYKYSTYFYNAIKKYGWENFEHNIIKTELSEAEAKGLEIDLIAKYKTTNSNFGYNLTFGGQGNIPTDKVRQKMSKAQRRVWDDPKYRNKMAEIRKEIGSTDEFKKKISKASKEAWKDQASRAKRIKKLKQNGLTKEFKEKMSILNMGENNGFYGMKHTEEAKLKMRNAKLGTKLTEEHKEKVSESLKKKVVQLSIDGDFIAVHNGISHIKILKTTSHISACCSGRRKTSGGFKWMYYDDYIKLNNKQQLSIS